MNTAGTYFGAYARGSPYWRISALFLRALGLIYFLHFLSVLPQVRGYIGDSDIAPIGENLKYLHSVSPWAPLEYPSLFWISTTGFFLLALVTTAAALSLLLLAGSRSLPVLGLLWLTQLSLVNSSPFFGFVWDTCLAQAGFASLFLGRWRRGPHPPPSRAAIWVLRFLFFHVMAMMAGCKIFSADPGWRNLTFLHWFWQNQPMPSALAWRLFQLPESINRVLTFATLPVEGLLALALFVPARFRSIRLALFFLSLGLQAAIFVMFYAALQLQRREQAGDIAWVVVSGSITSD